jgi:cytochrome P450
MPRPVQVLGWITRPAGLMRRAHARYGDVFTLRIAVRERWVVLAHPDAVKEVFTGDPEKLRAGEANRILLPLVGPSSVLLLDGREHLRQRRLMLPPFHGERMRRYEEIMREATERELHGWPLGEPVPLAPRMQAITLEVILRAVFGLQPGPELERLRTLLRETLDWVSHPRQFVGLAALGPDRVQHLPEVRRVVDRVDDAILEAIRARRGAPDLAAREDILSLLLQATDEDGRPMTDAELRDELVTLLVAGHETTATALSWTFERLTRHPEWHRRAVAAARREEPAELDAIVTETLRLRPVIPIVVRKLMEDMTIAGHELPAGAFAVPCIFLVHRRPDVYPEPDAFRPERFLDTKPGTYTWLPFGGGIRRCLGASFALFEMQVVLATILRELRVRPGDPATGERIARRSITLSPQHGGTVVASAA